MENALAGKRVLITQADAFMGPVLCEVFAEQGAEVVASADELVEADAAERIVGAAGRIDVLVANLAITAPSTAALEVAEAEWRDVFAALVDPLPRLVRAVAPAMVERRAGKILVMGSASALRGMKRASTYSAARGAQLAYVQAIGVELAAHNVQVNAVATSSTTRPTSRPRCRPTRASRSGWRAKCRWAGWCRRARMRCLPPTCAAARRTASLARCFRCVAAGWGGRRGLAPLR